MPDESRKATEHENEPAEPAAASAADTAVGASSAARGNEAPARSTPLDRFFQRAGSAAARGALAQTTRGLFDEPLPFRAEVDWAQALDLAMRRRDSERERLDRVEGKIAPIIGGAVAALALFVDKSGSTLDYVLAALLLVPLAMLFLAFRTKDYIDTPSLDVLVETYERWPLTYVRSVVFGTADAVTKNAPVIDAKARSLNRTMAVLFFILTLILGVRALEAINNERKAAAQPSPTTTTADPVERANHEH